MIQSLLNPGQCVFGSVVLLFAQMVKFIRDPTKCLGPELRAFYGIKLSCVRTFACRGQHRGTDGIVARHRLRHFQ